MRARRAIFWGGTAVLALVGMSWSPDADADPIIPGTPDIPGVPPAIQTLPAAPGGTGAAAPGIDIVAPSLAPAAAAIFLCPGVGGSASVIGAGGGYCDFNFQPVRLSATTFGIMHNHCEWGGASIVVEMWNCWRVWPGQPDHPAHPDPDIIPDGWGVPWAINGPSPNDQFPPPGLAPAGQVGPPPPPEPQVIPLPAAIPPGAPGLPPLPPGSQPNVSAPVPYGQPFGPPPGPFNAPLPAPEEVGPFGPPTGPPPGP